MTTNRLPPALSWTALDARAFDGRSYVVSDGHRFALACWNGERWVYPATRNAAIHFEPTVYHA